MIFSVILNPAFRMFIGKDLQFVPQDLMCDYSVSLIVLSSVLFLELFLVTTGEMDDSKHSYNKLPYFYG